ncbi:MAG: isoprenylcysteine carboxylmethyltransferase family protein [Proteobacteria bacterium]|nr:isoprenylcysteine carboxylmethyltransferase family protein [Pseudomonadota bacterium]
MVQVLAILSDYWASFFAFALFGVLHSVCAWEPFKDALARWSSQFFVDHFWRFIYCALSYAALYYWISLLHWGQHPDSNIWLVDYPEPLWHGLVVLHLLSVVLAYVSFIQSDYLEFLGLKQLWQGIGRLSGRKASTEDLDLFGTHRLEIKGIYGWVRHPMLLAGFLFLATSGPSRNNLVFLLMYTSYMLIGAYYEERRLIRIFGEQYVEYKRHVGAFFPRLRRPPVSVGG